MRKNGPSVCSPCALVGEALSSPAASVSSISAILSETLIRPDLQLMCQKARIKPTRGLSAPPRPHPPLTSPPLSSLSSFDFPTSASLSPDQSPNVAYRNVPRLAVLTASSGTLSHQRFQPGTAECHILVLNDVKTVKAPASLECFREGGGGGVDG